VSPVPAGRADRGATAGPHHPKLTSLGNQVRRSLNVS
jgi:hypothetical protein